MQLSPHCHPPHLLCLCLHLCFSSRLYVRPKELKLARSLFFPKKGTVYDHFYTYRQFGSWDKWATLVQRVDVASKLKVQYFRH